MASELCFISNSKLNTPVNRKNNIDTSLKLLGVMKDGNVLFYDALNTFYLRLYGVRHMVIDHSDSERGNPLPPHGLLIPISSKDYFINHRLCYTSCERWVYWSHAGLSIDLVNVLIDNFNIRCFPLDWLSGLEDTKEKRKEGNVLFNDALHTFYFRLYGVGYMAKDHSDSERKLAATPTQASVFA